jgi:hypothetical protein
MKIFITILNIIFIPIIAWFLSHIFAVFGFFLAVTYPAWWLVFPTQHLCLWCRIKRLSTCSFPHSFYSGGLVLLFSIFSIGVVFGESKILQKFGFLPTPKTVAVVIPTTGQYHLGEVFPVKVEVVGAKYPIDTVQTDIGFDHKILRVVDVSTDGSFAKIFVQKKIDNEVGYTRLSGGLPDPGFLGDQGLFGIVFFQGISPGLAKVEVLPSSMVLVSDSGTNVVKELASATYLVLPEKISPEEEEQQNQIDYNGKFVLGEKTAAEEEGTKIKFDEESEVMGMQTKLENASREKTSFADVFVELLGVTDRIILSFWQRIVS